MERVGGKLGKTASDHGGDWFSRTRDGRHRVWRSARHRCWRPGCWWRLGRVEGWRSTRHRVWRPSPWSLIIQDLFLSSFSRRISPFLRMEVSIAVYLKHNQTTSIAQAKTRESTPKLHTKRAEIVLCFACYQTPLHLNYCLSSSNFMLAFNKWIAAVHIDRIISQVVASGFKIGLIEC